MTKEEAIKIIDQIGKNSELTKKIAELSTAKEVAELLKTNGFDVTSEDIENIATTLELGDTELKDDQLDKVVGGYVPYQSTPAWLQAIYNKK